MVNTPQTVFVAVLQLAALSIPALSAPVLEHALEARSLQARGKQVSKLVIDTGKATARAAKDPTIVTDAVGTANDCLEGQNKKAGGHQKSIVNQVHEMNRNKHEPSKKKGRKPR